MLTGVASHHADGDTSPVLRINPVPADDGGTRLVGDVDYERVSGVAEAVTPVPGGVGPITDVWVLRNAVAAARMLPDVPVELISP